MADQDTASSETPADPASPEADLPDEDIAADQDRPGDDSFLLGVPGVEAEVLAELGRAEAELSDPEEGADESDGAVV